MISTRTWPKLLPHWFLQSQHKLLLFFPSDRKLRLYELDENIEVPLVYRQGPIDIKVELDMKKFLGGNEDGKQPCFMMVPCG